MTLSNNAVLELEFILVVVFSFVLPLTLLTIMFLKRAISRVSVSAFALALLLISGLDVVLLQRLSARAASNASDVAERIFAPEFSMALYLLPALFAGIGINVLSHILIRHLTEAEDRFDQHRTDPGAAC